MLGCGFIGGISWGLQFTDWSLFGGEGWAMLSLPGFAGWDLLGWLVRLGLLDSVCMLGFVVKGLLGQVY